MFAAAAGPSVGRTLEEEEDSDEGDDFYGEDNGDDEEEDEAEAAEARAYMERMDTELKLGGGIGDPSLGSRLGESFMRRPGVVPAEGGAARAAAAAAQGHDSEAQGSSEAQGEIALDWNLVQVGFSPSFSAIFNRKMQKLPLFPCTLRGNEGKPRSEPGGELPWPGGRGRAGVHSISGIFHLKSLKNRGANRPTHQETLRCL